MDHDDDPQKDSKDCSKEGKGPSIKREGIVLVFNFNPRTGAWVVRCTQLDGSKENSPSIKEWGIAIVFDFNA